MGKIWNNVTWKKILHQNNNSDNQTLTTSSSARSVVRTCLCDVCRCRGGAALDPVLCSPSTHVSSSSWGKGRGESQKKQKCNKPLKLKPFPYSCVCPKKQRSSCRDVQCAWMTSPLFNRSLTRWSWTSLYIMTQFDSWTGGWKWLIMRCSIFTWKDSYISNTTIKYSKHS